MPDLTLTWPGKRPPEAVPATLTVEEVGGTGAVSGRLDHGDNLAVMAAWLERWAGQVALVYLDPPFASGKVRSGTGGAYLDPTGPEALQALYERLWLTRDLLREDGSLLLHCDHRLSPALAMILDELFGRGDRGSAANAPGFRNEVIWHYGLGGSSRRSYPKKHDTILWYSKGDRWTFHPPRVPATSQRMKGQLKHQPDVWLLPSLNNQAHERCGYPTQKPLNLLARLIAAHSSPGDLVADPYGGSGTTAIAARQLGRGWLTCDRSGTAIESTRQRLLENPDLEGWELRRESGPAMDIPGRIAIEFDTECWRLAGLRLDGGTVCLNDVVNWSIGRATPPGEPFRAVCHTARERGSGPLETVARWPGGPAGIRVRVGLRDGGVLWDVLEQQDT